MHFRGIVLRYLTVNVSQILETEKTKIVLDLEGFYQTNFAERSNDFCRIPISLMKPSKSTRNVVIRPIIVRLMASINHSMSPHPSRSGI